MKYWIITILFLLISACASVPESNLPNITCKPDVIFLTPDKQPPLLEPFDIDNPETLTKKELAEIIYIQQGFIQKYNDYLNGF